MNMTIAHPDKESEQRDLFIQNGILVDEFESTGQQIVTLDGADKQWTVVPGFIDLHIHGSDGFDTMDATSEALHGLASALPREGTTSFLATTMTQEIAAISNALQNAALFESTAFQAEMIGVHLEGPFISPDRAGAQPVEHIIDPSILLFEEWQELSGNRIKLVTVASERPGGLEFIKKLRQLDVIPSIGHTDATVEEVADAVKAGANHVTHLFNQMSPFHHRKPGAIGGAFLEDSLVTEIIVDRIHSHPRSVELTYRLKGAKSIILITDAMRAKGLQPGVYDLGGQEVQVSDKDARLKDGTLAGSILTMENAAKNMRDITGCSLSEMVQMTSTNAATQLGLKRKGKISVGYDADLTILDKDWNVQLTICRGEIAYRKENV